MDVRDSNEATRAWRGKLDDPSSNFKTADQTEEGKGKYWTIFAVLLFGSFFIPMAQYYMYVDEEDD